MGKRNKLAHTTIEHSLVVDNYIDLSTGRLFLIGGVDEDLYTRAATGLALLNQANRLDRITIILNTLGGEVYQGLAIYDLIKLSATPVDVLVNGPCLSAGVIILQAAQVRAATSSSFLMVHDSTEEIEGLRRDVRSTVRHFDDLSEKMWKRILHQIDPEKQELYKQSWSEEDTYFTPEEALLVGLLDKVVE